MIDTVVLKRNWYFFAGIIIFSIAACFEYVRVHCWLAEIILLGTCYFGLLFREAKYSNGSLRIQTREKGE